VSAVTREVDPGVAVEECADVGSHADSMGYMICFVKSNLFGAFDRLLACRSPRLLTVPSALPRINADATRIEPRHGGLPVQRAWTKFFGNCLCEPLTPGRRSLP
jgi:hypothetical protein